MFQINKQYRSMRVIAILIIALLLSVLIQYIFTQSELLRLRKQFTTQSLEIYEQVSRRLEENETFIKHLVAWRKVINSYHNNSFSRFIDELLKSSPQISQLAIINVSSNRLTGNGQQAAVYTVKTLAQQINTSQIHAGKKVLELVETGKIRELLKSGLTISDPFIANNKATYLILKSVQAEDARQSADTQSMIAVFVDIQRLFRPVLARLKDNESFSVKMDDVVLYSQDARKINNAFLPKFSYRANLKSHSRKFSMNYERNLLENIAPVNHLLLVFTICVGIITVLVIAWALIVNSQKMRGRVREELRKNRETAVTTLDSIEEAVIIIDGREVVEHINPVAEKLIGLKLKQAQKKPIREIFDLRDDDHNPILDKMLFYCLQQGESISIPKKVRLWKKYKATPIAGSFTPLSNNDKGADGAVIVFRDLVDSIKLSEKLKYYATHDDTTNLINRREFINRLQMALDKSKSQGLVSVLIYLDLDQFKVVNDSCGHLVGDELLEKVARLLENNIRNTDTVARLGGDEFAILLEDCNLSDAKDIAGKLNDTMKQYHFKWEKKVFDIAASLGIVEVSSAGYSVSEILSLADSACYLAKQDGRNRYHIYSKDDDAMIQHRREIQWVQRIRQAYEDNRFRLFLQEIRPLDTSKTHSYKHYEVLLRMLGDNDKVLLPMSYILAAERYDKMAELDLWVVAKAFELIRKYIKYDTNASFAINLSGQSLGNTDTIHAITSMLGKCPELCSHVIFEITETAAITNPSQAGKFVSVLRRKGVRFSLDDFGSGLSSFAYLKNLKVDFLKIDGQFIRGIPKDKINYALVDSINQIGHVMGVKTIAEYVESEDIQQTLLKIGVDYGQGLWFSRPVPMEQFLLDERDPKKEILP